MRPHEAHREEKLDCVFYRTAAGAEPVRDWLKGLEETVRKEIGADILKVQWRWPVSKPLVDGLGGGLYEVRTTHDKKEYRVLFIVEDGVMVLLHGFNKRTQKTPTSELEVARNRRRNVSSS